MSSRPIRPLECSEAAICVIGRSVNGFSRAAGSLPRIVTRILTAEDEPRLSGFLSKGLRAAGYQTTVCDTGTDAATIACDADFDLVLLDIGLPGRDGLSVLRVLRDRGEQLPVIVLTAQDDVADSIVVL